MKFAFLIIELKDLLGLLVKSGLLTTKEAKQFEQNKGELPDDFPERLNKAMNKELIKTYKN